MSSASKSAILGLDRVSFSYEKGKPFIRDLSFAIGEGGFIGLLGANGSGKSTIMKLGCGILKPSSGTASLWGKALHLYNSRDRAKLISYLPQALDITVPFTIRELAGMGLYPYDIPPAMSVDEALDMVGLAEKSGALLTDLSGGERRRPPSLPRAPCCSCMSSRARRSSRVSCDIATWARCGSRVAPARCIFFIALASSGFERSIAAVDMRSSQRRSSGTFASSANSGRR